MSVFSDTEKAGNLPTPSTYSCLLEMHAATGQIDFAMKLYNSMQCAGLRPGPSTYTYVSASDVLMVYIKDAYVDLALGWLGFMGCTVCDRAKLIRHVLTLDSTGNLVQESCVLHRLSPDMY